MSTIVYPVTLVGFAGKTEVFSNEGELLEYLKFQNPTALASLNIQLKHHGVFVEGSGDGVILKKIEQTLAPSVATVEPVEIRISIKI